MSRPNKPWLRKCNQTWYFWFNGRQLPLGKDRELAHQEFHRLMAKPQRTPNKKKRKKTITLAEVVDLFLGWCQKNRAPDTYEWYRYRLERLCRVYPTIPAQKLTPHQVEEWVDSYEYLSVTSRRNYFRAVKRCLNWAKKQKHIKKDRLADLEVPSGEEKEICLEPHQFEKLVSCIHNSNLLDLVVVTWFSGCRPQESLIVESRHVDLKNQRWVFPRSESKGKKKSRVVYLPDEAMGIVRRLVLAYPEGPIFRNTAGKPWTTDAVNCAFTSIQVRMGKEEMKRSNICVSIEDIQSFIPTLRTTKTVNGRERKKTVAELRCESKRKLTQKLAAQYAQRYSLYALRHSFATNALKRGVDSLTVAILLGHKDPSTLARVYQHLNQDAGHLLTQARKAVA